MRKTRTIVPKATRNKWLKARIDAETHRLLAIALAHDATTFQAWLTAKVNAYVKKGVAA